MVKLLIIVAAFLVVFVYARTVLKRTHDEYVNVEAMLYGLVAALGVAVGMLLILGVDWLQTKAKRW